MHSDRKCHFEKLFRTSMKFDITTAEAFNKIAITLSGNALIATNQIFLLLLLLSHNINWKTKLSEFNYSVAKLKCSFD